MIRRKVLEQLKEMCFSGKVIMLIGPRQVGKIDYIEEKDGYLHCYEFKWKSKKARLPKSFAVAYPQHTFEMINRDNYLDFVRSDLAD